MKKQITILSSIVFIFFSLVITPSVFAQQAQLPGFDPSKLIDDRVFSNSNTFSGAESVQKFLEEKKSVLANTSPEFTASLREPSSSSIKETVEDPHPSLGRNRSAAELIWDAAQSSGLNPQVILVVLNKEQSLITGRQTATPEQLQRALDFSMGFGCPDTQPCGELYRGFYAQLFGNVDAEGNRYLGAAASLMKSFRTPGGRGPWYNGGVSKVGDTIVLSNTLGGYEGVQAQQTVTLSNAATAALYRYTPHVYNGNYNFWRFYTTWFGSGTSSASFAEGSLIKSSSRGTVYIVQGGARYKVLAFVAKIRNLNLSNAQRVSKSELNSLEDKGLYGLPDNTIIKVGSAYYVFLDNVKRPATTAVIAARGLNIATAIEVAEDQADQFKSGPALPPAEGAILRGETGSEVYLVQGGVLKLFTAGTLTQYGAAGKAIIVPNKELESYPKQGFVAPKDGSLVKGTGAAVYLMDNGQKRPLTGDLFRILGFSFSNVVTLTDAEINSFPTDNMPAPANMTFFTNAADGKFYVYINGGKHLISTFVAQQKSLTPDYKFDGAYVDSLPNSTPIIPKDNTILKGDKPDVYLVSGGVLHPLTYQAYVNRKITPKQIIILPQAEVDSYVKGSVFTK